MRQPNSRLSSQRGMTLIEVLVALTLLMVMLVAFLSIFDAFSRVAKSQGNIADATENLRYSVASLVRLTRMAGTGGLPLVYRDGSSTLQPLAVDAEDNVNGSSTFSYGGRTALAGTDVLRIRGVVEGDLYDLTGTTAIDFSQGTVSIPSVSPINGRAQPLTYPASYAARPFLVALQRPLDISPSAGGVRHYSDYRIVIVGSGDDAVDISGNTMTVKVGTSGTGVEFNPTGAFTAFPPSVAHAAGFLDDMVFFIANNDSGEPSLYRFIGSGVAEEMVPNLANLQVSFGCDLNRDGVLAAGEWFLSAANTAAPTGDQLATLLEMRLSVVARSQDPDTAYSADPAMPENAAALTGAQLKFRHRTITVNVSLRSHPNLIDIVVG